MRDNALLTAAFLRDGFSKKRPARLPAAARSPPQAASWDRYCRHQAAARTGYVTPGGRQPRASQWRHHRPAGRAAALGAIIGGRHAGTGAVIGAGAGLVNRRWIEQCASAADDVRARYAHAYDRCMYRHAGSELRLYGPISHREECATRRLRHRHGDRRARHGTSYRPDGRDRPTADDHHSGG